MYKVLVMGFLATQDIQGFPITEKRRAIGSPNVIAMPVLAPRSSGAREITWTFDTDQSALIDLEFVLVSQFKDSAGVMWQKNSRGDLEKIKPSPELRDATVAVITPIVYELTEQVGELADKSMALAEQLRTGLQDESDEQKD